MNFLSGDGILGGLFFKVQKLYYIHIGINCFGEEHLYQIDKDKNSIIKLRKRLFSDLGFKERENLQEWIAHNPDVLGENLLIIQKEFDGFNDTKERLDLLALDEDGNLVIIENKLDDTGRDVVWQALKYTSYCSTLTTSQIIKLYQAYL